MTKWPAYYNFDWMVRFTPQRPWIEGKGLLLLLAFFFTEICAGVYFVALFFNFQGGLLLGWIGALLLGGIAHMLYLGKPLRSWRILLRWSTSELSRGLWAVVLFGAVGFIQFLPMAFPGLPWTWNQPILKVVMGILCVLLMIHGFQTLSAVKALPMWNSPMLIPCSLASGVLLGSQIVLVMLFSHQLDFSIEEAWVRWSLLFWIGSLMVYLWGIVHFSETSKASINRLLSGDLAAHFYIGVVAIGIGIALIITVFLWVTELSNPSLSIFWLRLICVTIGDFMMRYLIMKSPLYSPLI